MSEDKSINWNEFEEYSKIENMKQFYSFMDKINQSNKKYLYRGQSNNKGENWRINSLFYRKMEELKKELKFEDFWNIFKEKIEFIQEKKNQKEESLSEILNTLSTMQHNGIPTSLIDFTSNVLHALWFACPSGSSKENEKYYFSIFILEPKNEIKNIIQNLENVEIYSCPQNIKRGLSQKSFFILHNKENMIKDYEIKEIKINYSLKEGIQRFLENKYINAENIYPDEKGLYENFFNKRIDKLLELNAKEYNDIQKIIDACKKYIEINPHHAEAYNNWGIVLSKKGNYDKAIKKYKKAIEIDPNFAEAYNNWGNALNKQGNYGDAIEKYKKVIKMDSNNAFVYNNWGNALNKQGNYGDAIEIFKKAIAINQNHEKINLNFSNTYCSWGVELIKQGNYNKAVEKINLAIEINSNNYFNLGIVIYYLCSSNKYLKNEKKWLLNAKLNFEKCIEINPNDKEAHEFLEKVKNKLKDLEK